jgi:hypothetical protein
MWKRYRMGLRLKTKHPAKSSANPLDVRQICTANCGEIARIAFMTVTGCSQSIQWR